MAFQKPNDPVNSMSPASADEGDGGADFLRQRGGVEAAAAAFQIIGHVQCDQSRQAEAQDGGGKSEMASQIRRVEDQNHRVGAGNILSLPGQNVARDPFVLATGSQAVDARQIHQ